MANSTNNNNVDDSESIASDESEEMIEVDEDEFDARRAICVADMKDLESQFLKLKDELIHEKQSLIDQKLREIEDESAEEYTQPSQKLKTNMEIKIKLASLLKEYRWKNIEHIYQYEVMSIKQSLESDKTLLLDKKVAQIENEIRQLEESKRQLLLDFSLFKLHKQQQNHQQNANGFLKNKNMNMMVNYDEDEDDDDQEDQNEDGFEIMMMDDGKGEEFDQEEEHQQQQDEEEEVSTKKMTKKASLALAKKKKKQQQQAAEQQQQQISSPAALATSSVMAPVLLPTSAPFIVYSLHDYDILEDWSIIKMHNNLNENLSNNNNNNHIKNNENDSNNSSKNNNNAINSIVSGGSSRSHQQHQES